MKIIEGMHYRAKDIGAKRMWDMGIPPEVYPTNQLVLVTRVSTIETDRWCVIDCQNGYAWKIRQEYLAHNCIWEAT